jgi:menaquinone-specific isochorismate synthase
LVTNPTKNANPELRNSTIVKIRVRTEALGELPELLQATLVADVDLEPLTWVRGGEGLVGFGRYRSIEIRGDDRFEVARRWWRDQLRELDIHNNVHGSGTGPILFASFAFDSEESSILTIPEVVIGRRGDRQWITWFGDGPQPELTSSESPSRPLNLSWQGENGEAWRKNVSSIVELIQAKRAEKVVLARALDGHSASDIDARRLLQLLQADYPKTWLFAHQGLVGATPELLVRLSKSLVTSRVLAGTIKRSGDDDRDLALAASLARSSKDLEEHEYAVRSVAEALAPLCSSTNVPESPFVLHLSNVMHLATDVTGVLTDAANPPDIFDFLGRLHPSAAVCGTPRNEAASAIKRIEGISRGRYAGPIGWVDIRSDGEFGIALRCGQIEDSKRSIRVYAGCGIVAGSDPVAEYAESEAKLSAMQSALLRH